MHNYVHKLQTFLALRRFSSSTSSLHRKRLIKRGKHLRYVYIVVNNLVLSYPSSMVVFSDVIVKRELYVCNPKKDLKAFLVVLLGLEF